MFSEGKLVKDLIVDSNGELIRVANAVIMPIAKFFALLSLSLLIIFLSTGHSSLSYHILGTPLWQSLRKLLLSAYLVQPLVAKAYMATQDIDFL